jgi:protein SCO1
MTAANPFRVLRGETEMERMRPIAPGIVLCVLVQTLAPAAAHSLADLQAMLRDREQNFQPIDKGAPQFALQDGEGRPVALVDFRGKVVVLHFISTSCRDGCPRHAERIAQIQSLIRQSPMKTQVQFVTITTDPDSDRGNILAQYGRAHDLDLLNWVFLTTKPDQPEDTTRKVAEQYGHRFEKTENGYQDDRVVTHVIDKEGHWRADFHGLTFEPTNVVVFVNALVNDIAKPHEEPSSSLWQKLKSWF